MAPPVLAELIMKIQDDNFTPYEDTVFTKKHDGLRKKISLKFSPSERKVEHGKGSKYFPSADCFPSIRCSFVGPKQSWLEMGNPFKL